MTRDSWNPAQYELFKDERQQPFFDLLKMVQPHADLRRAVDLGCGTGELTQYLHQHLKLHETLGLDLSPAMLKKSESFAGDGLAFAVGRLEEWPNSVNDSTGVDLIFSNAALQWVTSPSHRQLFPRLLRGLKTGGQIAIQMPANHDYPSHTLAATIASEAPFREAFGGYVRVSPVLPLEEYAALFYQLGLRDVTCIQKVYGHVLAASADVVEWVKGTLLTDYQKRLSPELYQQFLTTYQKRLVAILGDDKPFFYPFKRLLLHAFKY